MATIKTRERSRDEPGPVAAQTPPMDGGAGCRWLMVAAERAGLASTNGWSPPDPAAGRGRLPRIATRTLGTSASSVRAARDFTLATLHRWSATERSDDIAIVVSELLTNALRYALPAPGRSPAPAADPARTPPARAVRAVRGRRPRQGAPGASGARFPRRDRPRAAHHLRAQRQVGLHHPKRHRKSRVGHIHLTASPSPAGPGSRAGPPQSGAKRETRAAVNKTPAGGLGSRSPAWRTQLRRTCPAG